MKYIYGPIPSRRLGRSLGVSPIPVKTCNYSCIYCQLGRTKHLSTKREEYFPLSEILNEFANVHEVEYDVVTICGEGEPTLYSELGTLICEIKKRTVKPVAIITNGSLFDDEQVRKDVAYADIVLPSLDGYDEASFHKINRGLRKINFNKIYEGLKQFSKSYQGKLWLEIMMIKGINDHDEAIQKYQELLKDIKYDRIYINSPVRIPAEKDVQCADESFIVYAAKILNAIPVINHTSYFQSEDKDNYEAIINIIKRHPMNQFEIIDFLKSRNCKDAINIINKLNADGNVDRVSYKGITSYRLKM